MGECCALIERNRLLSIDTWSRRTTTGCDEVSNARRRSEREGRLLGEVDPLCVDAASVHYGYRDAYVTITATAADVTATRS